MRSGYIMLEFLALECPLIKLSSDAKSSPNRPAIGEKGDCVPF